VNSISIAFAGERSRVITNGMHIRYETIHHLAVLISRLWQIVKLLREEADLTRKEMAERLGCSDSTVKRIFVWELLLTLGFSFEIFVKILN